MKAIKIVLAGRELHLAFTVEAMFQVREQFGGSTALLNMVMEDSREGLSTACKAAVILAEQGELARRSLGYDKHPMVDAEAIAATLAPRDVVPLKLAVYNAISLGYGREIESEDDEVDLYMVELNEQKKNEVTRAHYIRMGTLSGLSRTDTLLSAPGEVGDLWELYLQAHGGRKKSSVEDE